MANVKSIESMGATVERGETDSAVCEKTTGMDMRRDLRKDILSGKLEVGTRLPSDIEFASQAGLSRPAVRAMYDQLVQEGLVKRVRPTGTFVRSNTPVQHTAKGLSLLYLLGLQLGAPQLQRECYWPGHALVGLERGAHENDDTWVYATENINAGPGQLIPRSIDMQHIDGVISYVLPSQAERENLAGYLEVTGKAHVALNEHFTAHGSNCVVEDCESGMQALINKVAELGHYDTVFCMYKTLYTIYPARLEAYNAAVAAANLPLYPPIVATGEVPKRRPGSVLGEQVGRRILEMARRPTAVVCACDELALGVIHFLQKEGVRVPEEMSVVGYDGVPDGETSTPALTTVVQDMAKLGEEAMRCLHRMIEDKDYRGVKVKVPVKFVFRESLGPVCGTGGVM